MCSGLDLGKVRKQTVSEKKYVVANPPPTRTPPFPSKKIILDKLLPEMLIV